MKHTHKLVIGFVLAMLMLPISNVFGQASNNLKENETIGPEKGTLIITGDGIYGLTKEKFLELIGGADAAIIVIPTAGSSEVLSDEFLENYKQRYIKAGYNNVTVLHTRDREEANSDEFVEPIKNAVGVIFSGGRQWRHADAYLNTKAHDEFMKLLDRGGVIAGGSAGATIQGSYLARGDTKGNTLMMGDHEVGLGFIKNVAIDQHLFKRNRQFDMFEILDHRPELLGIGLDEGTGIIVQGDKFEVIGESYVAIYDGTRWSQERDTTYQLAKGSREFYLLKAGDEYNLRTRAVITYRNREFITLNENELKKYAGDYQIIGSDVKFHFFVKDAALVSEVDGETFPLLPESETRFYVPQSNVYVDFIFDSRGKIIKAYVPDRRASLEKLN